MASLRAGGATDLFRRCQNLPAVQYAGRWSSLRTLLHYIKEASATQTMLRIPLEARAYLIWLRDSMSSIDKHPCQSRSRVFQRSVVRILKNPPPAILYLLEYGQSGATVVPSTDGPCGAPGRSHSRARPSRSRLDDEGRVGAVQRGRSHSGKAATIREQLPIPEPFEIVLSHAPGTGGVGCDSIEVWHLPPSTPRAPMDSPEPQDALRSVALVPSRRPRRSTLPPPGALSAATLTKTGGPSRLVGQVLATREFQPEFSCGYLSNLFVHGLGWTSTSALPALLCPQSPECP